MTLWGEISVCAVAAFGTGDLVDVCGKPLRILGPSRAFDTMLTVTSAVGGWYYPVLVLYRLLESLRLVGGYTVVLLDLWGLASWRRCTRPSWQDIHLLAWLARAWEKARQ
jgi:hypothetical protein